MISTQELRALLLEKGADLVGFGDLKGIGETSSPFSRCVSQQRPYMALRKGQP